MALFKQCCLQANHFFKQKGISINCFAVHVCEIQNFVDSAVLCMCFWCMHILYYHSSDFASTNFNPSKLSTKVCCLQVFHTEWHQETHLTVESLLINTTWLYSIYALYIPTDQLIVVVINHIEDPGHFYVQYSSDTDNLQVLMRWCAVLLMHNVTPVQLCTIKKTC